MKKHISQFVAHPLVAGSTIIFIGALFSNFFNFLFNLFMSRNLSVADYGILASLVSLITLCALASESFVPTIVSFAGSYFAKGEIRMVKALFIKFGKFSFSLGILVLVIFIIFSSQIGIFFKINDKSLIILVGLIVFSGFIGVVNRALLQAKLLFKYMAMIGLLGSFIKLAVGVILVFVGFKVLGGILAFFISFFIPYLLTFIPLKFIFAKNGDNSKINLTHLFRYGGPAALTLCGLTLFITTDIVLTKHFFDPKSAGIYAGLSLVGRIIFFLTGPIGSVMFPLIVQKHAKEEDFHNTFRLSLLLVFTPSVLMTIFYFLFPQFTIRFFLKNEEYLLAAPLLGFFGIFITEFALLSILANFYLSIKKTKVFIPVILFATIQATLIWFYHRDFSQIITISIIATGLPLAMLLLYYWRLYGEKAKK